MEEHPGLEALLECNEQVTVDIRNHLDDVANYLRRKEMIGLHLFSTVTDVTSRDPEYTRARMVFKRLQDMVEGNEKYYVMFMEYLRSNPQKFGNSISKLDKAYVDNGGILPADDVNSSSLAQGNSAAAHQATVAEEDIIQFQLPCGRQEVSQAQATSEMYFTEIHLTMNKDGLAKWLEEEGVKEDDVAILQDEGVDQNLFLDIEENDEYGRKLSKATLKQLPKLKEKLTKM